MQTCREKEFLRLYSLVDTGASSAPAAGSWAVQYITCCMQHAGCAYACAGLYLNTSLDRSSAVHFSTGKVHKLP